MEISVGDTVRIVSGPQHRGEQGKVFRAYPEDDKYHVNLRGGGYVARLDWLEFVPTEKQLPGHGVIVVCFNGDEEYPEQLKQRIVQVAHQDWMSGNVEVQDLDVLLVEDEAEVAQLIYKYTNNFAEDGEDSS